MVLCWSLSSSYALKEEETASLLSLTSLLLKSSESLLFHCSASYKKLMIRKEKKEQRESWLKKRMEKQFVEKA